MFNNLELAPYTRSTPFKLVLDKKKKLLNLIQADHFSMLEQNLSLARTDMKLNCLWKYKNVKQLNYLRLVWIFKHKNCICYMHLLSQSSVSSTRMF